MFYEATKLLPSNVRMMVILELAHAMKLMLRRSPTAFEGLRSAEENYYRLDADLREPIDRTMREEISVCSDEERYDFLAANTKSMYGDMTDGVKYVSVENDPEI